MDAPEEIVLDLNELAKGYSYYSVDNFKISPDQKLCAFAEDSVGLTSSESYICINLESTLSDEQRCADVNNPGEFKLIAGRRPDFKYHADHLDGRWVVSTNWNAPNFKLMSFSDGIWNGREQ